MAVISFLDLPTEIRLRIYEISGCLILSHGGGPSIWDGITYLPQYLKLKYLLHLRPVQPALTRVSKQVRAETLPIFYGALNLKAEAPTPKPVREVCKWLATIGRENAGMIRKIEASWPKSWSRDEVKHYKNVRALVREIRKVGVRDEAIFGEMFRATHGPNVVKDEAIVKPEEDDRAGSFEELAVTGMRIKKFALMAE